MGHKRESVCPNWMLLACSCLPPCFSEGCRVYCGISRYLPATWVLCHTNPAFHRPSGPSDAGSGVRSFRARHLSGAPMGRRRRTGNMHMRQPHPGGRLSNPASSLLLTATGNPQGCGPSEYGVADSGHKVQQANSDIIK